MNSLSGIDPVARITLEGTTRSPDSPDAATVTVVVVLDDAPADEALQPSILDRLERQQLAAQVETIVVAPGPLEVTPEPVAERPSIFLEIDPWPGRGPARNLAARHAGGKTVVFVDPRAAPADERWLERLVAPLAAPNRLAAVCSRVLPPHDTEALTYREGVQHPRASQKARLHRIEGMVDFMSLPPGERRRLVQVDLSGVAIRADVLIRLPFPPETGPVADAHWTRSILEAGLAIRHEPTAVLYLSPSEATLAPLHLGYDEGLIASTVADVRLDAAEADRRARAGIRADWRFLDQAGGFDPSTLDDWKTKAAIWRTLRVFGEWLGGNGGRLPDE